MNDNVITNENQIQMELENEKLENAITTLHEAAAGVTAVDAGAIVLEAELTTIADMLIAAGICTRGGYVMQFAENVKEAIGELAESGMIDISAVVDADNGVSGR